MSDTETFKLDVHPRVKIFLRRYVGGAGAREDGRAPVLLLHGASANHRTFLTGKDGGLAGWLSPYRDVWLLDWRGSSLVLDEEANLPALREDGDTFNFNEAASRDVRAAIDFIRARSPQHRVSVLGFCMGAAALAEAVALGGVTADEIDCLVLMTLGLFYETPVDGRLKGEDRILEQLKNQPFPKDRPFLFIDPRVAKSKLELRTPWPAQLNELYQDWPSALKSHEETAPAGKQPGSLDPVVHMCNRVSFMYGMPYSHGNLVDEIHATDAGTGQATIETLFGAIPLHMYIHGARNIRQGHATTYRKVAGAHADADYVSDDARTRFRSLDRVTLITGALNRLWHRDSIDRMYEWLRRGSLSDAHKIQKHVIPGYGHQDLLWGRTAQKDVFKKILTGLQIEAGQDAGSDASASRQRAASHGMPSPDAAASPRR